LCGARSSPRQCSSELSSGRHSSCRCKQDTILQQACCISAVSILFSDIDSRPRSVVWEDQWAPVNVVPYTRHKDLEVSPADNRKNKAYRPRNELFQRPKWEIRMECHLRRLLCLPTFDQMILSDGVVCQSHRDNWTSFSKRGSSCRQGG
jgi:hypothetical protein